MSATPGIRIVDSPVWWTKKMGLTQDLFESAELVQIKNYFWDPNTQPANQEYYKKYQATLKDGRRIVLPNRVSDISGLKWDIQPLMDWQAREQLHKMVGVPFLKGVLKTGDPIVVRGDWKKIDAALKECREYTMDLDQSKALVQAYEEYLPPALLQRHRQAFFDRSSTRDEAAELGTRAHDLIDKWLTNRELQDWDEVSEKFLFDRVHYKDRDGQTWTIDLAKEDPRVAAACASFYRFHQEHRVEIVASEFLVCDLANGTAGMIDNVSRVWCPKIADFVLAIFDYKTGNFIGQSMLLQTSGYARMFELQTGQRIEKVWIIQLDKETAEFRKVPVFETEEKRAEQIEAWDHAMWLYHWQKAEGKTTLAKPKDEKTGSKTSRKKAS